LSVAPPGPGSASLTLATPSFYLLIGLFGLFIVMLLVLRAYYPNRRRGFEGYLDAAGVSLAFLLFGVVLVIFLAYRYPEGNSTAYALYETILTGYWLAFAIPVVTVGSSVQARSRGGIRWLLPSVLVAVAMFFALFAYYYTRAG
jgi:hypothetical protein